MGGTSVADAIRIFRMVPMPATMKELIAHNPQYFPVLVREHIGSGCGYGWVCCKGDKYWLADHVLAEQIKKTTEYLEFLNRQREAIAALS